MSLVHGQWACPWSMDNGHVPAPRQWACPWSKGPIFVWVPFGSHLQDPFLFWANFGSHLGTRFFVWGPFWIPFGDPFLRDIFRDWSGPRDPFWGPWDPGWGERAAPGGRRPTFWGSGGGAPGNLPYFPGRDLTHIPIFCRSHARGLHEIVSMP